MELLDCLNEERKPELNLCIFEKPQKFHCVLSGELPVDFGSSQVKVNKGQCIILHSFYILHCWITFIINTKLYEIASN